MANPNYRSKTHHFDGGAGEVEAFDADVIFDFIDVSKFAGSLFEKVGRYDVHQWVAWAWNFDLKQRDGISLIFTRSDRHYLDCVRKCAEVIGQVAYAHFFVTTMLHRFTTRIPTWSDETAIPATLREILAIYDEFSEQPILGGGVTRGLYKR
jgi:hypothetical protein